MVDIALKALSPGINDTTTAIMAVDQLGLLLLRLASRSFPAHLRADEAGLPRVWLPAPDFAAYLRLSFDLVRINAKGNHALLRRLLRALARIGQGARTPDRRRAVAEQTQLLRDYAEQTLVTDYEKQTVRDLYNELSGQWEEQPPAQSGIAQKNE